MQLEEAYKLYMNDLYRYLFSLSRNHFVADDLVQDAFYRAFLTLEDYDILVLRIVHKLHYYTSLARHHII
uniref:RNA polymerase sigma-70 region 2 domain-containing protein n=1 Tax=Anaerobacillus isosaccharinicus TaxID=1532552 RepID=A0A1S2KZM3_9BACI|nr:hypothetical protein [Anaerobacillus isosaccharinicus]QOY34920.1 hypothetical protein AWH56_019705 [Anaerobacillus isosaccharinicus]